eukprot:Opistho-2@42251
MSLFSAREYWSTTIGVGEDFDIGSLCVGCVDNNVATGDKIVVGSFQGILRIYRPADKAYKPDHLLAEIALNDPIIQLGVGRFVPNSTDNALAVLHPRRLAVYVVGRDGDNQVELRMVYEHILGRSAANMAWGPFGGSKGKDCVCVQSLDGVLSFFDRESFQFACCLPGALIPGPLCYVARTDSFVTWSAARHIQSYRFSSIAASSRDEDNTTSHTSQNVTSGKLLQPDWSLNVGEDVVDIVVARFSVAQTASQLDLIVLGERNLFCLKPTGSVRTSRRLDYNPSCMVAYPVGVTETFVDGVKDNLIVASQTASLMIYSEMRLVWAAKAVSVPVALAIGTFCGIAGFIVSLDDTGHLTCLFLGTDPSTATVPLPELREPNYAAIESELGRLQTIIRDHAGYGIAKTQPTNPTSPKSRPSSRVEREEELLVQPIVPYRLDDPTPSDDGDSFSTDPADCVTAQIALRYTGQGSVADARVSVQVVQPVKTPTPFVVVPILESRSSSPTVLSITFSCDQRLLPSSTEVFVAVTYTSTDGEPRCIRTSFRLPLPLFCSSSPPSKDAAHKLTLETNRPPVQLLELFDDMHSREMGISANAVGFKFNSGPEVSVVTSKNAGRYRLQSDAFEALWLVVAELMARLSSYFGSQAGKPGLERFAITYAEALPLASFFPLVDEHLSLRHNLAQIRAIVAERASEYRGVQKRLLARYKDKTPVALQSLDVLLADAYKTIMDAADSEIECKRKLASLGNRLSCGTRLILALVRIQCNLDDAQFQILESALSPFVSDVCQQGWEERTDAAVSLLLQTCLARTPKERKVGHLELQMPTDASKLKKHILLLCERLAKGARLQIADIA